MTSYEKAVELLNKYVLNDNLKKHCYAVESCMRFYAKKLNQDEERWAIAGLLHDIDWETDPDTHPNTAVPLLQKAGYDQEIIDAILGHAYPSRTDVSRDSLMAKYLFACDELSGFVNAYSLMKPGRLNDVEAKSIVKKFKDKAFARNVSREDISQGIAEIGLPAEEHAGNVIAAMRGDDRLK
jgi:putative nucleotidyltransferase with HDIG domain